MKQRVAGQAADLAIWAFPDDDRIRRIAWFGHVEFVNRAMMRTQPSVLVYLAEVPGRLMRTNNLDCPINTKHVSFRTITAWVTVGTMTLLRIGDLWKGQRLFYRPTLEFETFKAVDITPKTVKEVHAGIKLEDGHHMLPFSEHPWHSECTQSFCSRVTLPDGRLLVIPALELIRFYFGSSSTLLRTLFRTDLKRELLYERVQFPPTTKHMILDLAEGMQGSSASDIARIAGHQDAWSAALHVGMSCLQGTTRKEAAYPAAKFPFRGRTDLQVHGQWLSRGSNARGIFIVNRIASCSHPFPFQKLTYNLNRPAHGANRIGSYAGGATSTSSGTPINPRLEERDASGQLTPHAYTFRQQPRFPDLEHKYIKAQRSNVYGGAARAARPTDPIEALALGATGTSDRRREAILVEHLEHEQLPGFLKHVIEACLQLQDVRVQLLTGDGDHRYTQPVALLFDEDGVIEDDLLIEEAGHSRPRRFAAFKASKEDRRLILVFTEAELLFPLAYPCKQGDEEEDAKSLMERVAKDFLGRQRGIGSTAAVGTAELTVSGDPVGFIQNWILSQLRK